MDKSKTLSLTLSQTKILDSPKRKQFADDNFNFDENERDFLKKVENTVGKEKLLVKINFSFARSVFKRLVLQTCINQGLFGKGLRFNPLPHKADLQHRESNFCKHCGKEGNE